MSEPLEARLAEVLAELEQVKAERDMYLKSLYAYTRDQLVPFTEEDLADIKANGVSFEEIIAELEERMERRGGQEAE
jgi:hypothetical protein